MTPEMTTFFNVFEAIKDARPQPKVVITDEKTAEKFTKAITNEKKDDRPSIKDDKFMRSLTGQSVDIVGTMTSSITSANIIPTYGPGYGYGNPNTYPGTTTTGGGYVGQTIYQGPQTGIQAPTGVWVAYEPGMPEAGVVPFTSEVDALRYAVEHRVEVKFVEWGQKV